MDKMNIAQTIHKTVLFKGVDIEVVEELIPHFHQKKYSKKQQIFETGDTADSFFVILRGWVKLFRISRDGEEVIINIFGPGESFAEAAVFGNMRAYPVNAQAVADVELIEIPRASFIQKIENDSGFALQILGSISSHQHYLVGQLEQVTTRTAPQRIGAFLLRFCQKKSNKDGTMIVDLPYDKFLISARLNIKPETFSRALAKLAPHGVNSSNGQITISDASKLEQFCDISIIGSPC